MTSAKISGRIGIHTGPVIVGDLGAGINRAGTALGETMNLAARLEGIAEPNTVVISSHTHRLVRGIFVEHDLGVQTLKGVQEPVHAYRVVQGSGVRSKLERTTRQLSKFVGHDLEIGLLMDRWEKTEYGEGQVVVITGEAGMGKSRLAVALRERLGDTPHTWLDYGCSAYTKNTAFSPVFEIIKQGLAITDADSFDIKLELLASALKRSGIVDPLAVPLLASFLDIPFGDAYPQLDISADAQRRRTLDLLVTWLIALGQIQPLIMVFEDLHWCDPSSLDLLGAILERNQTSRVLMILTTRPNFESPWGDRAHLTPIKVSNLNKRQIREIALGLSPKHGLPEEVLDMIVDRSNGIPLYVEELTQMVLEAGILQEREGRYELTGSLAELAIPATLQDSLMARLDRMSDAKGIAQMASVLGREFTYIMLAEISQKAQKELEENLTTLVKAELLFQRGTSPDSSYTFKHALIQDAAYHSMLKSVRRQLHERAANSLEQNHAHNAGTEPEVLARHLEAAGNIEKACKIYKQAGEQAQSRSAYKEEMSHYQKALSLLGLLPESRERDEWELQLQIAVGHAESVIFGYEHEVSRKTYQRARDLAERQGSPTQQVLANTGLSIANTLASEPKRGRQLAEVAVAIAKTDQNVQLHLVAIRALILACVFSGDSLGAKKHSEEAISLAHLTTSERLVDSPGADPVVAAYTHLATHELLLGYSESSDRNYDAAEAAAREIDDPVSLCTVLLFRCGSRFYFGDYAGGREDALRAIEVGQKNGIVTLTASARIVLLALEDPLGLVPNPVEAITAGLAGLSQGAPKSSTAILVSLLSNSLIRAGALDMAKNLLDMALALQAATAYGYGHEELNRLRGEVALRTHDEGETFAEDYFQKSLDLARNRSTKHWELRTALSIARLRKSQNRLGDGVAQLRPVYDWYTEGFEKADMVEAKAILDEFDTRAFSRD